MTQSFPAMDSLVMRRADSSVSATTQQLTKAPPRSFRSGFDSAGRTSYVTRNVDPTGIKPATHGADRSLRQAQRPTARLDTSVKVLSSSSAAATDTQRKHDGSSSTKSGLPMNSV